MQNRKYTDGKASIHRSCDFVILAGGAVLTAMAVLAKETPAQIDNWPVVKSAVSWLFANNAWIAMGLAVLVAAAKLVKERLDSTWVWSAVQAIIDRIQVESFAGQPGYAHHHRATLFRYRKYQWWPFPARHWLWPWGTGRWPCSGWLVPVVRSGETGQRAPSYFLAPPEDADKFEGVAGHVWFMNKEVALEAGGALQGGATDAAITDYAGKTFVSETWARKELSKGKTLAASFRGIPIEGKAGTKWGVLVLDSRDAKAAVDAKINIAPYGYCLGKLLERV